VADEGILEGGALFCQQGTQLEHLLSRSVVQVVREDKDHVGTVGGYVRLFFLGGLADPEQLATEKAAEHARITSSAFFARVPPLPVGATFALPESLANLTLGLLLVRLVILASLGPQCGAGDEGN
jgi:hypothetical protein